MNDNTNSTIPFDRNSTFPYDDNSTFPYDNNSTIPYDENSTIPYTKNSTFPYDEKSIFSFDEIVAKYKGITVACKNDNECPDGLKCSNMNVCKFQCDCLYKDKSVCILDKNNCEGSLCNEKYMRCYIGYGVSICGFNNDELCKTDNECLHGKCNNGHCTTTKFHVSFILIPFIIGSILTLLLICLICYYGIRRLDNRALVNTNIKSTATV